jgi:mxaJ protein
MRIALFIAALLVVAPAAARPQQPRTLRVCADPNNLPFSNSAREGFENKLAELVAKELGARIEWTWWAQRRGNVRETLNERLCDLIPGIGSSLEMLGTTAPYYRSTYVVVTRADAGLDVHSYDDERLRDLNIGVQLIGDDSSNTPPAHALMRRGIIDNVRGFMVYGDHERSDPQADIVEAVASGEIDIAFVWGPVGAFFAGRHGPKLAVRPVTPHFDGPQLPMIFDVSMGTRRDDRALRDEIEAVLKRRAPEIRALLASYRVPLVEEEARP